jgi:hypothetical protein
MDFQINQIQYDVIADCQIIRLGNVPFSKKPNAQSQVPVIVLLNTCLSDEIPQQRPVIEVIRNGKSEFREYELLTIFASKREAKKYAKVNGLTDVQF